MTYKEAHTEFCIRLYRWAKAAQQEEVQQFFPSFRLCNQWVASRCLFFQGLDPASRIALGSALLQRMHPDAVKVLGESVSPESDSLLRREDAHWDKQRLLGVIKAATSKVPEPPPAKPRQLRKAISNHFKASFGDRCLPLESSASPDLEFRMKSHGWTIETSFDFGRWEPEIRVEHSIRTGKWITKEEPAVLPFNCIGFRLNYGNVLGIGSGWGSVSVDEVEPVSVAVIDHCRRMIDLFPRLLEGLDLDSLSVD